MAGTEWMGQYLTRTYVMMWLRQKFVLSFRITYDDGFVWYADTESWFNLSSPKGDVTRDDTTIFSATQGSNVETILQPFKPM